MFRSTRDRLKRIKLYDKNPKFCLYCNLKLSYDDAKTKKFCNKSCSAKHSNLHRLPRTEESRKKTSLALKGKLSKNKGKTLTPREIRECKTCKTQFVIERWKIKKFCNSKCAANFPRKQYKRSKNEMFFAELCKKHFNNVLENVKMFNGWDADVILPDLKVAVLWNGVWHYKQIGRISSLKQTQNRDKMKIKAIREYGFLQYVVKDLGSFDEKFVKEEFDKFLKYILRKVSPHPDKVLKE